MTRTHDIPADISVRLRFALLGGLAFTSACVAHEALGHGGACLLTGGKVLLLTSVYFRCTPGLPGVDAAGPLMNLWVAAIAMLALRRLRTPSYGRSFVALVAVFNALWGAGYFLFSSVTYQGDWAFVLRDLHVVHPWAWRLLLGVLGAWLYGLALRATSPYLPRGAPLAWAYVAGGVVALASVLPFSGPTLPALREAAQESLLASVGLLYLAFARTSSEPSSPAPVATPLTRLMWPLGVGLLVVFLAMMGPGFRGA
jgi:hypothetical protein